jgi:hypothetical protein
MEIGPGTYIARAEAQGIQFGKSNSGNPQVIVPFVVVEGPHLGSRITWFGTITPKTAKRIAESLRYCGLRGEDIADVVNQDLPNKVQLVVENSEYQGKTRPRVQWINRIGGGGAITVTVPLGGDELRAFAAQMRGMLRSTAEVGANADAPSPAAQAPAAAPADDMPF